MVGEAADGASALTEAGRLQPEVVLLDVQLPDIDGFDVAARLTGHDDGPVVILVSSRDSSDFGPLVTRSGARGFVPGGAGGGGPPDGAEWEQRGDRPQPGVRHHRGRRQRVTASCRATAQGRQLDGGRPRFHQRGEGEPPEKSRRIAGGRDDALYPGWARIAKRVRL